MKLERYHHHHSCKSRPCTSLLYSGGNTVCCCLLKSIKQVCATSAQWSCKRGLCQGPTEEDRSLIKMSMHIMNCRVYCLKARNWMKYCWKNSTADFCCRDLTTDVFIWCFCCPSFKTMCPAISLVLPKLGHDRSQQLWQQEQLPRTPHTAQLSYYVVFQVPLRAVLVVTKAWRYLYGCILGRKMHKWLLKLGPIWSSPYKQSVSVPGVLSDNRKLNVATWFLMAISTLQIIF